MDGGYLRNEDLEQAHAAGLELFVPPKPARNPSRRGHELEPKPGDSEAVLDWKQRMASELRKRKFTSCEPLRVKRSTPICEPIAGSAKLRFVAYRKPNVWRCGGALAYNVMHFGHRLLS